MIDKDENRAARPARRLIQAAMICGALTMGLSQDSASANERIVTDWQTGIAISGYDPVAYYTEGDAVPGLADYEANWNGTTWRFRNAGNRAAFVANPKIYAPKMGGHDAYAISEGYIARGNPLIWSIVDGRLHLFNSASSLRSYTSLGDVARVRVGKKWGALSRTLASR